MIPSNETYRPLKLATSDAQMTRKAEMSSSVRAPRVVKSMPSASNSSRIHPTPTPSRILPPDNPSIVATRLASDTAEYCGSTRMPVANTIRRVTPARKASRSSGSGIGQSSGSGMRPPGAYG